jgi:hypothetical protein
MTYPLHSTIMILHRLTDAYTASILCRTGVRSTAQESKHPTAPVNPPILLHIQPHRFYFLGDDDLLEVLGQGASLSVIQPHLKKLFAGISRVSRVGGVQGCSGSTRTT